MSKERADDQERSHEFRSTRGEILSNVVKLVQATAWPLLVLCLFLVYRDSFSRTISEIPDLVSHATDVKIGSVSLTVERKAQGTGDERLAVALKGLSPEVRRLILETGSHWVALWGQGKTIQDPHSPVYFRRKLGTAGRELE